ncbi:prepilin-type N-terminal cleavage/methylation domain-containing protein [Jeongeupia wiesaeckerbachi]|uniref:PilW family protein n=1 Tax=Jeongeupia wiesaeckerbachi TaxID=3051218 RepID=UPI003D802DF8
MLISPRRQTGLSLVEILVTLAIGLILLGAAASVGLSSLSSSRQAVRSITLQQELQTTMSILTRELRRAGYSALGSDDGADATKQFRKIWLSTPLTSGGNDFTCAVFRYDRQTTPLGGVAPSGAGTITNDEITGIQFVNADSTNPDRSNRIFLLMSAPNIAVTNCTGSGWEALNTVDQFKVTQLTITPSYVTPSGSSVQLVQSVQISLTGTTPDNSESRTLTELIQIRNLPVKQ